MSENKKVIALIPARGGSKSIPYKNIKPFAGKPLIAWTIEVATQVKEIDRVIVSTDDKKIAEISHHYGAEVMMREPHLALDDSMPIDVIKSVLSHLKDAEIYDYFLYLEPTSPLRTNEDIRECLQLLTDITTKYHSVATFTEAELNPHRAWKVTNNAPTIFISGANPWLPRQQLPEAYQLNGAVYGFAIPAFMQNDHHILPPPTGAVFMPKNRSVDIDDDVDFTLGEILLERRLKDENP
ncbi:cytidylyltransferase domain-containing protein [Alteribacter populi]|uniref:acylneuraminate cytidylyltransferase family protein n=1 Tax=Alteribacter populi TaxID=2011011 RepID=UPI000BBA4C19|nr:acylneuraminate cytidylyltransferase family protein [Alteribacter populi]